MENPLGVEWNTAESRNVDTILFSWLRLITIFYKNYFMSSLGG